MRRGVLAVLAFVGWTSSVAAAPLDEAVALIASAHPPLVARAALAAEGAREHDWRSAVSFGWTQSGTEYGGAAGANAAFTLRIPLFSRSADLKAAEQRAALARERDAVLAAFLAEVERLHVLNAAAREAEALRVFRRDKLDYVREAVEQGAAEPEMLWPEAEALKRAEIAQRKTRGQLETAREAIARRFGGEQWTRLQALLAAIAN